MNTEVNVLWMASKYKSADAIWTASEIVQRINRVALLQSLQARLVLLPVLSVVVGSAPPAMALVNPLVKWRAYI